MLNLSSAKTQQLCEQLVDARYIQNGLANVRTTTSLLDTLLSQRQLPLAGYSDHLIEGLLHELAILDNNNFVSSVGIGEREGRCVSALVHRRHYGFTHGVGRSGDLTADQPKAAGSSLLVKITTFLVQHALKLAGLTVVSQCIVLPTATGMSITLALLAVRQLTMSAAASTAAAATQPPQYVIWCRVDQKTCFKSIIAAGYTPIVIENKLVGDELHSNIDGIRAEVQRVGCHNVAAIISTTSVFAPRTPDDVVGIAEVCAEYNIYHIVNNAYGLQSRQTCKALQRAAVKGGVDCIIQSTDKNFMVPVGGAVICDVQRRQISANQPSLVQTVSSLYPGRASNAAYIDLFITLLSLGQAGWKRLLDEREAVFNTLKSEFEKLAVKHGERLLSTPNNPISTAMTLSSLDFADVTYLGSMLYSRNVSGSRCITGQSKHTINGFTFEGYGAHVGDYPTPYMTAAGAIGMTVEDVHEAIKRIDKAIADVKLKRSKQSKKAGETSATHVRSVTTTP